MIFYPKIAKFAVEVPAYKGKVHSKIEVNHAGDTSDQFIFSFFVFLHKSQIDSNSQVHTLIQLKFGTLVGCIKANSDINFGDNTVKLHGDTIVYSCIQRLNCRHAYRVKCCLE